MNDDEQRKLARQLRTELASVIEDFGERQAVEMELDAAFAVTGPEADRQLAEVLRARPQTREWMHAHDPNVLNDDRLGKPPGDPTDLGTYFVCPQNDFDFVRDRVEDVVPLCPNHNVPLVRVSE